MEYPKGPSNIGAEIINNTVLGAPYSNCSVMGPKTLFYLLRPPDEAILI